MLTSRGVTVCVLFDFSLITLVYATGPNSELKTDFRGNQWFCHGGGGTDKRASKRERRKFFLLRAFYQGFFSEHVKKEPYVSKQ